MYDSSGNVAYSLPKKTNAGKGFARNEKQYRKRHHAQPKRIEYKPQSEEERIAALFHRQMARKRIGAIVACIFVVFTIASAFTGILYRYSKILELNYGNVKIERELKQIEKERNQLKEELSKKTDLKVIRALAVERLGMQDPGQKQIVMVSIPVSDRLIIENNEAASNADNARLDNAMTNIEGFFKTIR